jgi:hypothetical protein
MEQRVSSPLKDTRGTPPANRGPVCGSDGEWEGLPRAVSIQYTMAQWHCLSEPGANPHPQESLVLSLCEAYEVQPQCPATASDP